MIEKHPFIFLLSVFFGLIIFPFAAKAQIQPNPYSCQDSLRIQPTYPCGVDYNPVCGCNGVTYRNICNAMYRNGVNFYTDGPCEEIDFDFFPNPVTDFLNLRIARREKGNVNILIYDYYGKNFYTRFLRNVDKIDHPVILETFPNGLYFIIMYDETGFYKLKRFLKQSM